METFTGSFPYPPLSAHPKSRRLVTLIPGEFDGRIRCVLFVVNDAHDAYEALSYVWGNPQQTTPILLNGRDFPVTTSLSTALRYLRHGTIERTLWVDAICINQSDVQERNAQIPKMMHIYKTAFRTLFWLGVEVDVSLPEDRDRLSVKEIFRGLERMITEHNTDDIEELFPGRTEFMVGKSLSEFYHRPWFRRRWVIQEFAMSDGKHGRSKFLCGKESVDMAAPIMAYFHFGRLKTVLGAQGFTPIMENLRRMFRCSAFHWETSATTTELADRIFKIMNLTDTASDLISQIPLLLPDYTKPASQVFTDLARFLIEQRQLLDVFYGYRDPACGTPSWAPTWGNLNSGSGVYIGHRYLHLKDYMEQTCLQNAQVSFSDDGQTLFVLGMMVDQIDLVVTSDSNDIRELGFDEAAWRNLIQQWEGQIFSYLRNIEELESRFDDSPLEMWRDVLFHTFFETEQEKVLKDKMVYECLMGRFQSYWLQLDHQLVEESLKDICQEMSEMDADVLLEKMNLPLSTFLFQERWIFMQISAFASPTGYLGITDGGSTLQKGDVLCLFPGLTVPFIIRPSEFEDRFELVGPCYVYGLMKLEEQSFVISQGYMKRFAII
ncbi:heterokaryon incompatibility protein-domain-containing protein [Hyaloscypha finlandica]|nr:heterokaryon incompatibility protein-domain-containing protein [Hyaloscypha finlandica]